MMIYFVYWLLAGVAATSLIFGLFSQRIGLLGVTLLVGLGMIAAVLVHSHIRRRQRRRIEELRDSALW